MMTTYELAKHLIEHAEPIPDLINTARAAEIIGWMDPDTGLPEDLTPESFTAAWNSIIRNSMRRISIDNGASFIAPEKAVELADWDTIVSMMDDDIREQVADELAPCSNADFLRRYLEYAFDDMIIG